ncbi:anthrone oxygenase family protein [Streptomyces sp. NPDC028635]|uniref:anthrone oxygenase family protein n=1 Tax=Streptomyces sp. NPDC028635 TaxID=3154800 RepID=UPI0033CC6DF0
MIEGPYLVLTVVGVLATALVAGIFCAFSVLVMRGLAALPPAQGAATMNAINRAALTPAFMVVFLGATLVSVVLAVVTFVLWPREGAVELLIGSASYLLGAFGVTAAANVPRNDALMRHGADSPEAAAYWPSYLREWTRWNHVRTMASAASALAYVLALL